MTNARWFWMTLALAALPLALAGCSDDDDDTTTANDDDTVDDDDDDTTTESCPITACESPIEDLVNADSPDCECVVRIDYNPDCDPLVPLHCGLPFPSNFHTKADDTETGLRVNFHEGGMPVSIEDKPINPTEFNRFDGFSPASQILFFLGNDPDDANFPPITDIGKSLEEDSPTVLLDADTGEWVVHFTEVDSREAPESEKPLILRPMVKLENGHRYIVAVRNIANTDGEAFEPSAAFQAYRDNLETGIPGVEARRETMEDIFEKLETAGVERDSLQLAWDFTTASRDSIAGSLVAVSDMALEAIDAEGGVYQYTIASVQENVGENTQTRIEGTVRFPLFLRNDIVGLNAWDPGSELNRNEDGEIEQNGWVDKVPFRMQIPPSVASGEKQARFIVYGHGLLGSRGESNTGYLNKVANEHGFVIIATDWWGLNEQDSVYVGAKVLPDFSNFYHITDRFHQGVLNTSLLSDFVLKTFAASADFASGGVKINNWLPEVYYYGNSQGGIMGVPAVAIDRNVERAVFGVPGVIYSILIPRSSDFVDLDEVMKIFYTSEMDWQIAMSASQMLWDRVEPVSFLNRLFNDPIPGRPVKTAIWQIGVGDAQVNPVTMDIAARTMGIPQLGPANYPIFGVDEVEAPYNGSVVVYYDPELESNPLTNTFPPSDEGTHEAVRRSPASQAQLAAFFQPGGSVLQFCTDTCDADDHPEAHQ